MNRAEATRQVLLLEAAAAQLKERAKTLRSGLDADARAELAEQGTAPTWRLDIGTWSLPVARESVVVTDQDAFLDWLAEEYPTEVEEIRRPRKAFFDVLTQFVVQDGADVVHTRTGAIIPGLAIQPGGTPLTLRFRPAGDAQAVADQHAEQLVKEITAGLGIGDDPVRCEAGTATIMGGGYVRCEKPDGHRGTHQSGSTMWAARDA